jgi:parallel beta-helix repeat protein
MVLRNANMVMKNSIVSGFMSGGIMLYAKPSNIIKIYKSYIRSNKFFGIQILGNSQSPSIQYCNIENNHCAGIQICTANKATIRKNVISLNHTGIEVISSDPTIIENDISHNHRGGILVNSIENLIAIPKIHTNKIFSNNGHGIQCIGMGNKSLLSRNQISFNKKAGIEVA